MTKTRPRTGSLWRPFLLLIPLAIVLAVVCFVYVRLHVGTYTVQTAIELEDRPYTAADVTFTTPGVLELVSVEREPNSIPRVTFRALSDGQTDARITGANGWEENWSFEVKNGAITRGKMTFSGWEIIQASMIVFLVATVCLFGHVFRRLFRSARFGFEMISSGGGLLFCLFQVTLLVVLAMRGSLRSLEDLLFTLASAADYFAGAALIPGSIIALLVALSNIALIRHEGLRPVNLLGIGASIAWFAMMFVWLESSYYIFTSIRSFIVADIIETLFGIALAFGECLFISTAVCGWLAARHVPKHGADYLVILGCGLRPDGTPCPLLAGRVDRAFTFDEARVAAGDAPATFVPSGGQGPDEVVSEAQSMGTYLEGKGVDAQRIVLENRSETTTENMAFSREVIEKHAGRDVSELSVVFSTTNYHVLRGYTCAAEAGMTVEGIGSKTRAYFWPNAALREFVGLLAAQFGSILQTYLLISAGYVIAELAILL